jgi:hypothetical protein
MVNNRSEDDVLRVTRLEANKIRLIDDKGTSRAEMYCGSGDEKKDGYVVVHLYDGERRPLVTIQVDDEGASISLFNERNAPCVSLGVFNERANGITICDHEGNPRISIGGDQTMELSFRKADGEECWQVEG